MQLLRRAVEKQQTDGTKAVISRGTGLLVETAWRAPGLDEVARRRSISELHNHKVSESDLEDILDTAYQFEGYGRYKEIQPSQIRTELEALAKEVKVHNPNIVMEIGTKLGGTFYTWSRYFEEASAIISLDLPGGEFGGGYTERRAKFYENFAPDKKTEFFLADSHQESTKSTIENWLETEFPDQKIDFLFIDGDHTYAGVKQDFEMYRDFVADGGIIAFHDIVEHPNDPDCEVDELWMELKQEYRTKEIIASDDQTWAGIGIVYWNNDQHY